MTRQDSLPNRFVRKFLSGRNPLLALATSAVSLVGCSGSDPATTPAGTGGSVTAGSVPGAGGGIAQGGAAGVGGAFIPVGTTTPTAAGGAVVTASGGASTASGGASATGGTVAAGGTSASAGGSKATGGTSSVGGTSAKGGTSSVGGTSAKGGTSSVGGTTAKGGTSSVGGTTAAGGGSSCPFPTTFKWKDNASGPIALPANGWVSIKDFTNVIHNGQHLIYSSTHDTGTSYGSQAMAPFTNWSEAATAVQTKMTTSTVAPELMYFAPKSTWILSYQWCASKFCYGTSTDPTKPNGWAMGKSLMTENITGSSPTGPIDQVVICDSTNCYLFYADDNGHIYRASMPIGNFPGTFSGSQLIMTDTKANLFEAVEVYTVKGTGEYLMIVEAMGSGGRYFRAFRSTSLGGTFTAIAGAATESTPFAGKNNVTFTTNWTNDISHGDLVRTSDQTRTVDPCKMEFLYQGKSPTSSATYDLLPYRLGLLTKTN